MQLGFRDSLSPPSGLLLYLGDVTVRLVAYTIIAIDGYMGSTPIISTREARKGVLRRFENADVRKFGRGSSSLSASSSIL